VQILRFVFRKELGSAEERTHEGCAFFLHYIHKKTAPEGGSFFELVAGVGFEPADAAGICLQMPRAGRPSAKL
jgi:hypothetical protein